MSFQCLGTPGKHYAGLHLCNRRCAGNCTPGVNFHPPNNPLGCFHHLHVEKEVKSQNDCEALALLNNNELTFVVGALSALQMFTNLFL